MESEVQEVPVELQPTGDDLLAELRPRAPGTPPVEQPVALVKLELTLEDASLLFEKLRKELARPPRPNPRSTRAKLPPQLLVQWLEILTKRLRGLRPTCPRPRKKSDAPTRHLALELLRWEAGYLRRIVQNEKRDAARKEATYEEYVVSSDALKAEAESHQEQASEGGGHASAAEAFDPSEHPVPDTGMLLAELQDALRDFPGGDELATGLEAADGNVSKLARNLGQPQRTVAHAVARLRQHLIDKGFSA